MKYIDAIGKLPAEAFVSSTFGNPGCGGGYSEIWRTPDGHRWMLSNGRWDDDGKTWSIEEIQADDRRR